MLAKPKTLLARYQYDALDRLTVHGQPDRLASQRFYCESRLATEIQGNVRHSITQHGDQLLAQQKQDSGRLESTLLATDLQRSVLITLSAINPRASAYSPYGHRPGKDGLYSLSGFNGQRSDPVTGDYLLGNGYRAFNPELMRFNSPDSLSPFGKGGLNAYAYCLGDPINREDSTGHAPGFLLGRAKSIIKNGISQKHQKKVIRISETIFTSQDNTKRGSRLTFHAHGGLDSIADGKRLIGPEQLIDLAKQSRIKVEKFDSVRLLVCDSASKSVSGGPSIGEQLSVLLGRPVKAYVGKVEADNISLEFNTLKVGEKAGGRYAVWINKGADEFNTEKRSFNYHPVTFDPSDTYRISANIRR